MVPQKHYVVISNNFWLPFVSLSRSAFSWLQLYWLLWHLSSSDRSNTHPPDLGHAFLAWPSCDLLFRLFAFQREEPITVWWLSCRLGVCLCILFLPAIEWHLSDSTEKAEIHHLEQENLNHAMHMLGCPGLRWKSTAINYAVKKRMNNWWQWAGCWWEGSGGLDLLSCCFSLHLHPLHLQRNPTLCSSPPHMCYLTKIRMCMG